MSPVLFASIGNTNVRWAVGEAGGPLGTPGVAPAAYAATALTSAAGRAGAHLVVAVVSAAALGDAVEEALTAGGRSFLRAGRDVPIPIETRYRDPAEIGADRLCNALAARETHGAPVVSGSAGTCLTVEAVDEHGVLLGGAIAAGVPAAMTGLRARVPHLAEAVVEAARAPDPVPELGRSTVENIALGLWLGAAAAMDALLDRARRVLGGDVSVVLTGGDAPALVRWMRTEVAVSPDLTLDGARLAFEHQQT